MVSRFAYVIDEADWNDFWAVCGEYAFDFTYSREDDGYHVHTDDDMVEDILWAIEVEANARQLELALAR